MSKILAVGSPKGGVAKTTTAVTLATIAARLLQLRVLLVDADPNQSAHDWAERCNDTVMPFDIASGADVGELAQLRRSRAYDLHVIDLPGAREGAFKTILRGGADSTARPVADLLLVPVHPELMDQRPVIRVIHDEVIPLGLPHLVVATMVRTVSMPRAAARCEEMRELQLTVTDAMIREYSVYDEAVETDRTVLDIGGRYSYAREAESDYRALAADVFARLGFDVTALQPEEK